MKREARSYSSSRSEGKKAGARTVKIIKTFQVRDQEDGCKERELVKEIVMENDSQDAMEDRQIGQHELFFSELIKWHGGKKRYVQDRNAINQISSM